MGLAVVLGATTKSRKPARAPWNGRPHDGGAWQAWWTSCWLRANGSSAICSRRGQTVGVLRPHHRQRAQHDQIERSLQQLDAIVCFVGHPSGVRYEPQLFTGMSSGLHPVPQRGCAAVPRCGSAAVGRKAGWSVGASRGAPWSMSTAGVDLADRALGLRSRVVSARQAFGGVRLIQGAIPRLASPEHTSGS